MAKSNAEAIRRARQWADWYHVHSCTLRMIAAARDPNIDPQYIDAGLLEWFDACREAQRTHDSGALAHV